MSRSAPQPVHSITELNRLRDRARRDAELLRREALQDFWRGADQVMASAAESVQRSATRWAQRLARHGARRAAGPNPSAG